jgi:hypothetical protein
MFFTKETVLANNTGIISIKNQLEFRKANYGMVFMFCKQSHKNDAQKGTILSTT